VIVDSIAFHFRHDIADMAQRARILADLAQTFHEVAYEKRLAVSVCESLHVIPFSFVHPRYTILSQVVVMNQVTTRIDAASDSAQLVPALGESWFHACSNRLMMFWSGRERRMQLLKSTSRRMGVAKFGVDSTGICDLGPEKDKVPRAPHSPHRKGPGPSKSLCITC